MVGTGSCCSSNSGPGPELQLLLSPLLPLHPLPLPLPTASSPCCPQSSPTPCCFSPSLPLCHTPPYLCFVLTGSVLAAAWNMEHILHLIPIAAVPAPQHCWGHAQCLRQKQGQNLLVWSKSKGVNGGGAGRTIGTLRGRGDGGGEGEAGTQDCREQKQCRDGGRQGKQEWGAWFYLELSGTEGCPLRLACWTSYVLLY